MKTLSHTDLEDLLDGATILGSGGGGPQFVARQVIEHVKAEPDKSVRLADPEDLDPSALMAVVAGVGSPDAAEKGFPLDIPVKAFDALASEKSVSYSAVLSIELGAGNSFVPLSVAFDKGIPFVDASGARRAVPSLTQCTYAEHGLPISPLVMLNRDHQVVLDAADAASTEGPMRAILSTQEFDQDAGIAFWSMDAGTMTGAAIPRTVSTAMGMGAALREALGRGGDPVEAVRDFLDGYLLFKGRLHDVQQTTAGGFDLGRVGFRAADGEELTIYNQNENLMAWSSARSHPLAMAPDLICYLTTDGETFSNAELDTAKGKEVAILGFPASAQLRSPALVSAFLAALRAIGYGGPYVEIEKLAGGGKSRSA